MKSTLPWITGTAALIASAFATEVKWLNKIDEATSQAQQNKSPILVVVSGVEWCGPCKELEKEVFTAESFPEIVTNKAILAKFDFTRPALQEKTETPENNRAILKKYHIEHFPTTLLCDSFGTPAASFDFDGKKGTDSFKAWFTAGLEKIKTRDSHFDKAKTLSGAEKAKEIEDGLSSMHLEPLVLSSFYKTQIDELKVLNPKNNLVKTISSAAFFEEKNSKIADAFDSKNMDATLKSLDELISSEELVPLDKQKTMFIKAQCLCDVAKFDEADKLTDEMKAIDPQSEFGSMADKFKTMIKKMKEPKAKPAPAPEKKEPKAK